MSKVFLTIIFAFFLFSICGAQTPNWVDYKKRAQVFPESEFIVGFTSERNVSAVNADAKLEELVEYARVQFTESIYVTIKSISTLNVTNENTKTQEFFQKTSSSYSKINVSGYKKETYYDPKSKEAFAIVYANKKELSENYIGIIQKQAATIKRKADLAVQAYDEGNYQAAIKNFFETLLPFRELEEAYTISTALNTTNFQTLSSLVQEIEEYKKLVSQGIAAIQQGQNLSLADVAYLMAKGYQVQLKPTQAPILLEPFTYRDSEMASAFTNKWQVVFEKNLIDVANLNITLPGKVHQVYGTNPFKNGQNVSDGSEAYKITGTFWEEGQNIRIVSILRVASSGKPVASMEGMLPLDWAAANGVELRPSNYAVATEEVKTFVAEDPLQGDIGLDAWTNKGQENVVFTEDEEMRVYIKVNKPCFIRFVYHTADNQRVLLLNNLFIDASKVNVPFEVPEEFICTAPFGVEHLQINAQSEKFVDLSIRSIDGYDFIEEDLPVVLAKTRGFKKKPKVQGAEKRIMITTLPKS